MPTRVPLGPLLPERRAELTKCQPTSPTAFATKLLRAHWRWMCNSAWHHCVVPEMWHSAMVVAVFQRGDLRMCEIYRPFSFVLVLASGFQCPARLWPTKFGYQSARRLCRLALFLSRGGFCFFVLLLVEILTKLTFVDLVSPGRLVMHLRRFGFPSKISSMIQEIYTNRRPHVRVRGQCSQSHSQEAGISQRCSLPLFSPCS